MPAQDQQATPRHRSSGVVARRPQTPITRRYPWLAASRVELAVPGPRPQVASAWRSGSDSIVDSSADLMRAAVDRALDRLLVTCALCMNAFRAARARAVPAW